MIGWKNHSTKINVKCKKTLHEVILTPVAHQIVEINTKVVAPRCERTATY